MTTVRNYKKSGLWYESSFLSQISFLFA